MSDNELSKNYQLKIFFYILKHGYAKNISEIAGNDTNHTKYKEAMLNLIEKKDIMKTERGFELSETGAKLLNPMKAFFVRKENEMTKTIKKNDLTELFNPKEKGQGAMNPEELKSLFSQLPEVGDAMINQIKLYQNKELEYKLRKKYKEKVKDKTNTLFLDK